MIINLHPLNWENPTRIPGSPFIYVSISLFSGPARLITELFMDVFPGKRVATILWQSKQGDAYVSELPAFDIQVPEIGFMGLRKDRPVAGVILMPDTPNSPFTFGDRVLQVFSDEDSVALFQGFTINEAGEKIPESLAQISADLTSAGIEYTHTPGLGISCRVTPAEYYSREYRIDVESDSRLLFRRQGDETDIIRL